MQRENMRSVVQSASKATAVCESPEVGPVRRVPEIVLVPVADAAPGEEAEEEAPPGNNQI